MNIEEEIIESQQAANKLLVDICKRQQKKIKLLIYICSIVSVAFLFLLLIIIMRGWL